MYNDSTGGISPETEGVRYPEDLQKARRLAEGIASEWTLFGEELSRKAPKYIEEQYPNVFSVAHKDEIVAATILRLEINDYRALRQFEGKSKLSSWVTQQLKWAILDWLTKNSDRIFEEWIDPGGSELPREELTIHPDPNLGESQDDSLSDRLSILSDEERWAFSLRYYDFTGFSTDETHRLAKKRGVPYETVAGLLVKYFETDETDVLAEERAKQAKLDEALGRINTQLRHLDVKERIGALSMGDSKKDCGPLMSEIDAERERLLGCRQKKIKDLRTCITTPFSVVAEIMGIESESTARSYVFKAKNKLITAWGRQADKALDENTGFPEQIP